MWCKDNCCATGRSVFTGVELKIFGDEILDVSFYGGCSGNLKGIAALAKGQKISDVQQRLSGIRCGNKITSCPDQFAQILAAIQQ